MEGGFSFVRHRVHPFFKVSQNGRYVRNINTSCCLHSQRRMFFWQQFVWIFFQIPLTNRLFVDIFIRIWASQWSQLMTDEFYEIRASMLPSSVSCRMALHFPFNSLTVAFPMLLFRNVYWWQVGEQPCSRKTSSGAQESVQNAGIFLSIQPAIKRNKRRIYRPISNSSTPNNSLLAVISRIIRKQYVLHGQVDRNGPLTIL